MDMIWSIYMAVQVNVVEAKAKLSELIDRALAGEEIVIAKGNRPMVDLVPHKRRPVVFGFLKGKSSVSGNLKSLEDTGFEEYLK